MGHPKLVVITGGNSGIGLACVRYYLHLAEQIVVLDQRIDHPFLLENKQIAAFKVDVTKPKQLEKTFSHICSGFNQIDTLIISAGTIPQDSTTMELDEDEFNRVMDINVKGVFFSIQKAAPYLRDGAAVAIIASAAASGKTAKGLTLYATSKAAASMLAKSFAAELVDRKIRVNTISPGVTQTPLMQTALRQASLSAEHISKTIPLKRIAEPSEIAELIGFVCSDKASYMTGVDVLMDGGFNTIQS